MITPWALPRRPNWYILSKYVYFIANILLLQEFKFDPVAADVITEVEVVSVVPAKRGPGRPKKSKNINQAPAARTTRARAVKKSMKALSNQELIEEKITADDKKSERGEVIREKGLGSILGHLVDI